MADLRVVFDNRSAEERRGIDLCTAGRIAIEPGWTTADKVPTEARPGSEMVQVDVTNHTGHRLTALYLFPEKARASGPELLGDSGLPDGASVTIAFARPAGVCQFAARLRFAAGGAPEEMNGLDLCRSLDLVLPPRL